ncbi:SxtJ family membrane protein [Cylindrospermopsis raciborskii]|uniref:SxtJ n=1 Tax=Cylindrospermopsis raciborskii T3 TaxID=398006 RepID=B3EYG5_9CYAN|nr:SxtJ family membrane protein [Cylindrospermopsis raciborskii]ABI75100.1 SxtJ [Cylindrospermopsis raciborskii T3]EFA72775.1 sxtJ [Raphidiopsis brookii D9]MCZ2206694.1 SxtJ family membrane protein [Cylindrospermopsis raciborskii PAMP2011]QKS73460.1 SxtJ [Cylindrospermopsis raciborskii CHAB3409]
MSEFFPQKSGKLKMEQIKELDKKGLREFGLIGGSIVAVLFGFLLPVIRHHSLSVIPWVVAGFLWIWAIIAPTTLSFIYQIWMRIGLVLGWIQTRIILGVLFYIMITPIGFIRRLLNQDPMTRIFEPELPTYRQLSKSRTTQSMEKPF